jgi:hypothetical protein
VPKLNPNRERKPEPAIDISAQFLYDLPTAARLMATNQWAVRALIKNGDLEYVPVGHAYLISPDAILEFITKQEPIHGAKI